MSAIIDTPTDDIAAILLAAESNFEQNGWGRTPPTVYRIDLVYESADNAEGNRDAAYLGSSFPLRSRLADTAIDELTQLVARQESPVGDLFAAMSKRRPVAHMFISECWLNSSFSSREQLEADGRSLLDMPDSEMARFAVCVSGDTTYMFFRRKGGEVRWIAPDHAYTEGADVTALVKRLHVTEVARYAAFYGPDRRNRSATASDQPPASARGGDSPRASGETSQ